MSKLLLRWNLGPDFKRKLGKKVPDILLHSGELFIYKFSKVTASIAYHFAMTVYVGHTGEHLGTIVFHKEVMKVMEADFLTIHVSEVFLKS